jgi:beta-lactamase regulating signal transducer with metallopeptidase domain
MLQTILTINSWTQGWLGIMGAVLWQSALLVGLATVIAWYLRRSSPTVRYWLWQIVAIKLLLMPFWTFAIPILAWPESKPLDQSAEYKTPLDRSQDMDRLKIINPVPLTDGGGTQTVSHTESRWKIFTAITWQTWLLLIWLAIILWQIVRLLWQRLRLAKLLKQGVPASAELSALVAALAGQIGLRRVPAAVCVAGDCPLFVCGLRRPRLVLPGRLMASLDHAERRQVILHELGHIKRHDLFWGWPVEIARIVYFFNPLVYWAGYQLRLERELACDQLAMARSGHPPADYARTLVQVVSHASQPASVQAAAIAAGLTGNEKKDEG